MSELPLLHVMAGVLIDAQERVLLAQRPAGREDAGRWEFPGGKCEIGEAPHAALARELEEELGIRIGHTEPLIRVPQLQRARRLRLEVLRVLSWHGQPQGREGQRLRWQPLADIEPLRMPAADRPALAALRQPPHYWITRPDISEVTQLEQALEFAGALGAQRLQLRLPDLAWDALQTLAAVAARRCRSLGIELLINAPDCRTLALTNALGVGAQMRQSLLMQLRDRPAGLSVLAASCHDCASLIQAERLGCDFALLSPVQATATHPQAQPLGWERFAELRAAVTLPVYALGGVGPDDLRAARDAGAQGVAGIRGFFPT